MTLVIAIGGGEIRSKDTFSIDQTIVKQVPTSTPKVLFIPTASKDSQDYWEHFRNLYEIELKCICDSLFLYSDNSYEKSKAKILNADIIYVGGGNTLEMMKKWRSLHIDELLYAAYLKGKVMSGLSAGAICWFEKGFSDSMKMDHEDHPYIQVQGLGIYKFILCPEYDDPVRKKEFLRFMSHYDGKGIGIESNAAVFIKDGIYRSISAEKRFRTFFVYKQNGKVIEEIIDQYTSKG